MFLYVGGDCLTSGYQIDKQKRWTTLLYKELKFSELFDESNNRYSNDTIIRCLFHSFYWYLKDSRENGDDWFFIISLTSADSFDYSPNEIIKRRLGIDFSHFPNAHDKVRGVKDKTLEKTINVFNRLTNKTNEEHVNSFFNNVLFLFNFFNGFQSRAIITSTYPIKFNESQSTILYKLSQDESSTCSLFLPPLNKSLCEYMGNNQISKDGYHFNESGHQIITKLMSNFIKTKYPSVLIS